MATLDDLARKTVQSASRRATTTALSRKTSGSGRPGQRAITLVTVPEALEDEDLLEMLNTGLLEILVVDDWKAKMWAQVLPKLDVHATIELRAGAKTGWAVRRDSPGLKAELLDFYVTWAKKQGVIPYRQMQYMSASRS